VSADVGLVEEVGRGDRHDHPHHCGDDLERAVRPLTDSLAGVGVDIDVERLAAGDVRRNPQWK